MDGTSKTWVLTGFLKLSVMTLKFKIIFTTIKKKWKWSEVVLPLKQWYVKLVLPDLDMHITWQLDSKLDS